MPGSLGEVANLLLFGRMSEKSADRKLGDIKAGIRGTRWHQNIFPKTG